MLLRDLVGSRHSSFLSSQKFHGIWFKHTLSSVILFSIYSSSQNQSASDWIFKKHSYIRMALVFFCFNPELNVTLTSAREDWCTTRSGHATKKLVFNHPKNSAKAYHDSSGTNWGHRFSSDWKIDCQGIITPRSFRTQPIPISHFGWKFHHKSFGCFLFNSH